MIYVKRDRSNAPSGVRARAKQRLVLAKQLRRSGLSAQEVWNKIRRRKETRSDIKSLFAVFHDKCAYCESDFNATGRNQLEHYRPKSKFFDEMFVWNNWLCSCGICNETKWSHWPVMNNGTPVLIDPAGESPEKHIGFVGADIVGITTRGEETIRMVGLDRIQLARDRRRWLALINSVLILSLHDEDSLAETAKKLLIWAVQPRAPFSAMVRSRIDLICPGYSGRHVGKGDMEPKDFYITMSDFINVHANEIGKLAVSVGST